MLCAGVDPNGVGVQIADDDARFPLDQVVIDADCADDCANIGGLFVGLCPNREEDEVSGAGDSEWHEVREDFWMLLHRFDFVGTTGNDGHSLARVVTYPELLAGNVLAFGALLHDGDIVGKWIEEGQLVFELASAAIPGDDPHIVNTGKEFNILCQLFTGIL